MNPKAWKMVSWVIVGSALVELGYLALFPMIRHHYQEKELAEETVELALIEKAYEHYWDDTKIKGATTAETKQPTVQELINQGYLVKGQIKVFDVSGVLMNPYNPKDPNGVMVEVKSPEGKFVQKQSGSMGFYKSGNAQ